MKNLKENLIPIVFSSDKNYFPYCCVAIESIIKNSSKKNFYEITVLQTDLGKKENQICQKMVKGYPNITIHFIDVSDLSEKYHLDSLMTINHIRVSAYYRLLIDKILPDYDKILYLDSDLVACKDLAILYHTDISDNYLGAVLDQVIIKHYFKTPDFSKYMISLGMKNPKEYFNSGVLIMNLKEIRKKNLFPLFLEIARKNNQYFHDQNVLNAACGGRVYFLKGIWNIQCCNKIEEKTLGILHYCSGKKPWNSPYLNHSGYWWKYAKKTPLKKELIKRNPKQKWFRKVKNNNGHNYIYCFGFKLLSYKSKKKYF